MISMISMIPMIPMISMIPMIPMIPMISALGALLVIGGCGDGGGGTPKPPASTPPVVATRPPIEGPPMPEVPPAEVPNEPTATGSDWTVSTAKSNPRVAEVGGLVFPRPGSWVWSKPRMRFRTLQYDVPSRPDSDGSAEIVFSLFRGSDGGPTDMNIERWVGQFRDADGEAVEAVITTKEIGGMSVTRIETAGSYQSMGAAAPRTGQGLIGAIIEAPGRRVFVRLVGPEGTVAATREAFDAMLDGVMPAG
mgnify:CR=1 FL=1